MEDNVSWLPHSNDCFCIWKHLLNHICVTEESTRPQKPPNMVVYQCKFSQPYSQCPVWARAYVQSRLSLVVLLMCTYSQNLKKKLFNLVENWVRKHFFHYIDFTKFAVTVPLCIDSYLGSNVPTWPITVPG